MRDSGCGGGESRCRVEGTQSGLQGARGGRTNPSPGGNNILPGRLRGFRARKSLSAGLSRRRETKRNKQGFYRRQGEELGSSGSGPGGSRVPSPPCSPVLPDVPPVSPTGQTPAAPCAPLRSGGADAGRPGPLPPGANFCRCPVSPPRAAAAPSQPRAHLASWPAALRGAPGGAWGGDGVPGRGRWLRSAAAPGGTGRHRRLWHLPLRGAADPLLPEHVAVHMTSPRGTAPPKWVSLQAPPPALPPPPPPRGRTPTSRCPPPPRGRLRGSR